MARLADTCIVVALDERYLVPACVTMASIAEHSDRRRIVLRALHSDLSRAHVATLVRFARTIGLPFAAHHVAFGRRPARHLTERYVTSATYLRLRAHETVLACDRLIYIDTDTLVRGDLTVLGDATTRHLGAVPDGFIRNLDHAAALPGYDRSLMPRGYFNAGLYVTDFREHKRRRLDDRAQAFIRVHPTMVRFGDQDAMNATWHNFWEPLPPEWNHFVPLIWPEHNPIRPRAEELARLDGAAKVLHFVGRFKPWHRRVPWPEAVRDYIRVLGGVLRWLDRQGEAVSLRTDLHGGGE